MKPVATSIFDFFENAKKDIWVFVNTATGAHYFLFPVF